MISLIVAAALTGLPSQVPKTFYAMDILQVEPGSCRPVEIRKVFDQMRNSIEANQDIEAVRVLGFIDGDATVFMVTSRWDNHKEKKGIMWDVFSSSKDYCEKKEGEYIKEYKEFSVGKYYSRPNVDNLTQMLFGSLRPEPDWPY